MTKTMTKPDQPRTGTTIVVFGRDEHGRPRAGRFQGSEIAAAQKAAQAIGLAVLQTNEPEAQKLMAKVPTGRLHAPGHGLVPPIAKDIFGKLEDLAKSHGSNGGKAAGSTGAEYPLPVSWDAIEVGHLVLFQEKDPADGWWQGIVSQKIGDMFTLRWLQAPRERPAVRHRFNLALIYPGEPGASLDLRAGKSGEGPSPYPNNWADIALDKLVLAKEDGPMQQWWEATPIAKDGDNFSLRWRDHQQLGPIVRPRLSLALLHPNPRSR